MANFKTRGLEGYLYRQEHETPKPLEYVLIGSSMTLGLVLKHNFFPFYHLLHLLAPVLFFDGLLHLQFHLEAPVLRDFICHLHGCCNLLISLRCELGPLLFEATLQPFDYLACSLLL